MAAKIPTEPGLTNREITAAEAYVLLDPEGARAAEAFKIAFLSLAVQGMLRIAPSKWHGLLWTRRVPVVTLAGPPPPEVLAAEIAEIVARARRSAAGIELRAIAKAANRRFGDGLKRLKPQILFPALVARGLLRAQTTHVMLVFRRTDYAYTEAGHAEQRRITALLERLAMVPALLASDPAEARAILRAAGPLVLLAPRLTALHRELAALTKPLEAGDAAPSWDEAGSDIAAQSLFHTAHHHTACGAAEFGPMGFDFGVFDAQGLDFSAFDAGFDASMSAAGCTGGDGGGSDGGGSDGGGHSGGDGGGHHGGH